MLLLLLLILLLFSKAAGESGILVESWELTVEPTEILVSDEEVPGD
jgi:hypothetical protein